MYNVTIVSENSKLIENIAELIDKKFNSFGINISIKVSNNLLTINKQCNILFVDDEFFNLNKLSHFQKYLSNFSNVLLIIITNDFKSLYDYHDLHPFDFIKKDSLSNISNVIEQIIIKLNNNPYFITIINRQGITKINCNDIIFCNSQGHTCFIKCIDKTYKSTKYKLSTIETNINNSNFYIVNRSYLVNWSYVNKIENKNIILNDNTVIKISKNKYRNVLNAYLQYLKRISLYKTR